MRVAIVPARGGSKRIPRKNIRLFHGVPIIARTVRTLLESDLFSQVVVSTDDSEITQIARQAGASVPFRRPARLADDQTGTEPVILDALSRLGLLGNDQDEVAVVYPAAVFMTAEDLKTSLYLLNDKGVDQVMSACKYSTPIQRAWRLTESGDAERIYPQFSEARSQDLEETYFDAGQFYWWAKGTADLVAKKSPLRRALYLMPQWRVQDIDNFSDWEMAERMFSLLSKAE